MDIALKLDKDFIAEIEYLKVKYPEELEKMNGFHETNLDLTSFIDNFIDEKVVADTTIDSNSNSSMKNIAALTKEIHKPYTKLLSYNKLYYEAKKKYGIDFADRWLDMEYSGALYMNDSYSASFQPYCYNYDLKDITEKGLFFINGLNNKPPKHWDSFNNHVMEFIVYASGSQSGAVGIASYLIEAFYFYNKAKHDNFYNDVERFKKQQFQNLIYNLNQAYVRINEPAFTNVSIFDRNYLIEMFGSRQYPDGSYVIDYIEDLIQFQKDFMEVVSEVRNENMWTFPVLTYCLLYDEKQEVFLDEEFAKWSIMHNLKWMDSNFYIGKDITTLSSCCFTEDEEVFTIEANTIKTKKMKDIQKDDVVQLLGRDNKIVKGRKIQLPNLKTINIKTHNGVSLTSTYNHIHKIDRDGQVMEVKTMDLKIGDKIAFIERSFENKFTGILKNSKYDTYEFGKIIGMLIGNGHISKTNDIKFCLNYTTKHHLKEFLINELAKYNLTISECTSNSGIGTEGTPIYSVIMKNEATIEERNDFLDAIAIFIAGRTAHDKVLTDECLNMSEDFRNGIIDGYEETDGGNSNRIYSVNKNLIDSFARVLISVGLSYNIDIDEREKSKGGKLSDNPIYCIRYYSNHKNKYMDLYKRDRVQKLNYFKIVSIAEDDYDGDMHCFEVFDDEQYFTLANGIYTHNCRLVSSKVDINKHSLSGYANSIGGSSLSIGSVKVSTINMMRIALESKKDKTKFKKILKNRMYDNMKILDVQRGIIKRNIDKGLLPLYTYKLMELKNQYSTIGVTALADAIEYMGLMKKDELGHLKWTDEAIEFNLELLKLMNEIKDDHQYDYSFNIEMIPGEQACVRLCEKDKLLYPGQVTDYIYANQFISLKEDTSLNERIKLSALFDKNFGGGNILHINVENQMKFEDAWKMMEYIASEGVIYFAFTTKIHVCKNMHSFVGTNTCPSCGGTPNKTFARIVGYYTPIENWSKTRRQEGSERKWYTL